jgi:hypothetical protein
MKKNKNKLTVASTMCDQVPSIYIDNYLDSEDGGFKIMTAVDFGPSIVCYSKTLCQSKSIGDTQYKGVVECPDFQVCEYDDVHKKFHLYDVVYVGEADITDEQIKDLRTKLKDLPNKEI